MTKLSGIGMTYLFEAEDWINLLVEKVDFLTNNYHLANVEYSSHKEYLMEAEYTLEHLEKFDDPETIKVLNVNVRQTYLTADKPEQLNKYIGKLLEKFQAFYFKGLEFEEFYCDQVKDESNDKLLSDSLYGIRSYFKRNIWDIDSLNKELTMYKVLAEYYESINASAPTSAPQVLQPIEPGMKNSKDTPTKDQILLLNELGILNLPAIKNLTTENKGKLFARLLNRNEKNVTECIRNCDPKGNRQAEDNPYIYENKVAAINQLLTDIGFFTKL